MTAMTNQQHEYIRDGHDSVVNYINRLSGLVEALALLSNATERDKQV